MKVLFCAGRNYFNTRRVFEVLDALHKDRGITLLIHGAGPGGDMLAERWAKMREVPYYGHPARWRTGPRGKGEGPWRNREMFKRMQPEMGVAFPGGAGTADMVKVMREAGIEVSEIDRFHKP